MFHIHFVYRRPEHNLSRGGMRYLSLLLLVALANCQGEKDLVTNLPGVTFQTNFKTYSGYLKANTNGTWKMHYFLTESKSDAANDPLLLWFNGGPGCSSFGGMFEELGPFYVNYDGNTLFENVYSWNAKANVLALESPIGVGFSYDTTTENFTQANDDQTAMQNYNALKDFFSNVQPQYANRTFYLSGESYAGIYIPMLSKLLVQGINSGDFPNANFQGAAIGNGFMHVQYLMNSLVLWSAYHGRISQDNWDLAKTACQTGNLVDHDKYNYQQFMTSSNGMDYNADNTTCGQLIAQLITDYPAGQSVNFDQYNMYQDCYVMKGKSATGMKRAFGGYPQLANNTAKLTNYDSTDNQWGYGCWNDVATAKYLNRKDVQAALHIDQAWQNQSNGTFQWHDCNDPMYNTYNLTYKDTYQFFNYALQNTTMKNFRFLIYNGDVDTVCNYLGDSWFIRDVASQNNLISGNRGPWLFAQQFAGFNQRYTGMGGVNGSINLTVDVLTVKGAGHFVPNDRPGPSVQMITNFMFPVNGVVDYNSVANVDPNPQISPLLANGGSGSTNVPTTTGPTTTTSSATFASFSFGLACAMMFKLF